MCYTAINLNLIHDKGRVMLNIYNIYFKWITERTDGGLDNNRYSVQVTTPTGHVVDIPSPGGLNGLVALRKDCPIIYNMPKRASIFTFKPWFQGENPRIDKGVVHVLPEEIPLARKRRLVLEEIAKLESERGHYDFEFNLENELKSAEERLAYYRNKRGSATCTSKQLDEDDDKAEAKMLEEIAILQHRLAIEPVERARINAELAKLDEEMLKIDAQLSDPDSEDFVVVGTRTSTQEPAKTVDKELMRLERELNTTLGKIKKLKLDREYELTRARDKTVQGLIPLANAEAIDKLRKDNKKEYEAKRDRLYALIPTMYGGSLEAEALRAEISALNDAAHTEEVRLLDILDKVHLLDLEILGFEEEALEDQRVYHERLRLVGKPAKKYELQTGIKQGYHVRYIYNEVYKALQHHYDVTGLRAVRSDPYIELAANFLMSCLRTQGYIRVMELRGVTHIDPTGSLNHAKMWNALRLDLLRSMMPWGHKEWIPQHIHARPYGYALRQTGGTSYPMVQLTDPSGHSVLQQSTGLDHNRLRKWRSAMFGYSTTIDDHIDDIECLITGAKLCGIPREVIEACIALSVPGQKDRISEKMERRMANPSPELKQWVKEEVIPNALHRYTECDDVGYTASERTLICVPKGTAPYDYQRPAKAPWCTMDKPYRYKPMGLRLAKWAILHHDAYTWIGEGSHYTVNNPYECNELAEEDAKPCPYPFRYCYTSGGGIYKI